MIRSDLAENASYVYMDARPEVNTPPPGKGGNCILAPLFKLTARLVLTTTCFPTSVIVVPMTLSRPVAPVRGMRRRHTPHRKAHHGPPLYLSLSPCPDTPHPHSLSHRMSVPDIKVPPTWDPSPKPVLGRLLSEATRAHCAA